MNITFLIGNGFDLRVGMKTRFIDMYEGYIGQTSPSETIRKFKELLREDAPEYKTWGDFEMAMAQRAKEFEDEKAFIECIRDFKVYMASHLQNEQDKFKRRVDISANTRVLCANEVSDSIHNFYIGLTPNVRNEFESLGVKKRPDYHFISFNYTTVFDQLLSHDQSVLHIHGKLDADIVLGADNLSQVKDLPYRVTKKFERAFIKPEFNKSYDNSRLNNAKKVIEQSDIICIYGMSLGESDKSWVICLKNWLLSNSHNHLVYFVHDETVFNKLNWCAIMDEEDSRVERLMMKIFDSSDVASEVLGQVHIPVGYDLFAIDEILEAEKTKVYEERKRIEELSKRSTGSRK